MRIIGIMDYGEKLIHFNWMLFIYIGLQIILLILGIIAFKISFLMWHVCAGDPCVRLYATSNDKIDNSLFHFQEVIQKWYKKIQWYPKVEEIIVDIYGADISHIILDYLYNINIEVGDELTV